MESLRENIETAPELVIRITPAEMPPQNSNGGIRTAATQGKGSGPVSCIPPADKL